MKGLGVDEVYVVSVNDSFVMNAWVEYMDVKNIKPIADGNGQLTRQLGMLVDKENLGFGQRSWRYAMVVKDGVIDAWFEEQVVLTIAKMTHIGKRHPKKSWNT